MYYLFYTVISFFLLSCSWTPAPTNPPSLASISQSTLSFSTDQGSVVFNVELAKTFTERQNGLMRRASLPKQSGMLFFFASEDDQKFWMKDTWIPLDMIFMDHDWTVVGMVENAEPNTIALRSISKPSRYVLEINGGLAKQRGIKAGTKATFTP